MDNITINELGSFFSGQSMGTFFVKAFGIVFSLLFTTYAVISYKQVQEITKAVLNSRNKFVVFFSLLQIFIGLFLLAFAILVL